MTPQLSALANSAQARGATPATIAAISDASARTGVNFSYLLEKAAAESGFRTDARAGTSSAAGLYQFTEGTWLDMVRKHGAETGLGDEAKALSQGLDTPLMRRRLLALRDDAGTSAYMAAAYAKDNREAVEKASGRPATDTDLYMAHFLGPQGAAGLLTALRENPAQPAAALLPEAAAANRGVFFDKGRPVTARELYDRFERRFGDQPADAGPSGASAFRPAMAGSGAPTASGPLVGATLTAGGAGVAPRLGTPQLSPSVQWVLSRLSVPGEAKVGSAGV